MTYGETVTMERVRTSARPTSGLWILLSAVLLAGPFAAAGVDDEKVARGERIYHTLCATCHGRYGRGDGPLASALQTPLPDFSDPAILGPRSDEQLLASVTGMDAVRHTPMAIGQVLQEGAVIDAIAYLRTLYVPGRYASLPAGRDVYQASCWVCHGREGNGQGPAAATLKEKRPRDFTDPEFVIEGREEEIERVVALGPAAAFHGSSFMPEWSSRLSPQQIRDVVEYLKTFHKAGPAPSTDEAP
jgi:cytochrome c oxidase cbb3-type subunit 3